MQDDFWHNVFIFDSFFTELLVSNSKFALHAHGCTRIRHDDVGFFVGRKLGAKTLDARMKLLEIVI